MYKHSSIHALALLLVVVVAPLSRGDTVDHVISFTTDGVTTALDTVVVTPFDPALGTLNEVRVSIQGGLVAQFIAVVPGLLEVKQDFTGLGGDLFDFNSPATLIFQNLLPAPDGLGGFVPTPYVIPVNFQYDFEFNAASDIVGQSLGNTFSGVIVPPTSIVGTRADFQNLLGANLLQVFITSNQPGTTITGGGGIFITYDYTPGDPAAIPLPSAAFGGIVLLTTLAFGRRRRA